MPPKIPNDDYSHGQMMGMLVIIQLLENAMETSSGINGNILEKIKQIATKDLAGYLEKPEEDVILLVQEQLRKV